MQSSRTSTVFQSSFRAARKSEWLRSALAHHYSPDPGVENEVVVLATGIDQYLQEVFHHLAFYNCDDLVSEEDFRLLCLVLGISITREVEKDKLDGDEGNDICSRLPCELNFKEFHARLCGYFSLRAQNGKSATRLPVTEETEHIEREIRLRWPRVRRRKCVSFDLPRDHAGRKSTSNSGAMPKPDNLLICALETNNETVTDASPQRTSQERLEMENASLRELVEDLRSALQSSDARCMALEVALRRQHVPDTSERRGCTVGREETKYRQLYRASRERRRATKDLLRELELIRASRDGQLEEAMRFNQRLEEELGTAYGDVSRLGEAASRLRRENAQIKRRAEEARGALAAGLERVRAIQEQAQQVPSLQDRVQDLQTQLEGLRSRCTCRAACENRADHPAMPCEPTARAFPTGRDEACIRGAEEGLQRAVEGRAASDEEEEERGKEEGQCCLLEVKRLINRLHNCAKGCQNTAARHLLISQHFLHDNDLCGFATPREVRGRSRKHHVYQEETDGELEKDLQLKQEVDMLRLEVQMVETERVRLSLLEEKLTDALTLLLQLRAKRVSRRALGKILMDTLDVCCTRCSHEPTPILQVVDALCHQLLSSELLDGGEDEEAEGARPSVAPGHRNSTNPLVISC